MKRMVGGFKKMKSLAKCGFGPYTYLIEDEDLPFEVSNKSTQDVLGLLKTDTLKKETMTSKSSVINQKKSKVEQSIEGLIQSLKEMKIHVLRGEDPKTNTIYLKLDWGVLSTIRISDQIDSGKYSYKYNVIIGAKKGSVKQENGVTREYYTLRELKALFSSIEIEREEKLYKYGQTNYQKYIRSNQQQTHQQKGFFENAKQV